MPLRVLPILSVPLAAVTTRNPKLMDKDDENSDEDNLSDDQKYSKMSGDKNLDMFKKHGVDSIQMGSKNYKI